MSRPTQEELDDIDRFAETGKSGCLLPDDEAVGDTSEDSEWEDRE